MKKLLLLVAVTSSVAAWPEGLTPLEHWSENRPEAAAALGQWVTGYPAAASVLFLWDRDHPLRAQFFWSWMVDHPNGNLEAFAQAHRNWPVIDLVMKPHRPAVNELIGWIHKHPAAVKELATQPRGFAWIGFHLYKPLWSTPAEPSWDEPLPTESDPVK